jgi:hypothetical protein
VPVARRPGARGGGTRLRAAAALAAAGAALGAARDAAGPGLAIEHTPPECAVAGRPLRLVACVTPRSRVRAVRARYRWDDAAEWRDLALRSDAPCFSAALPAAGPPRRLSYVLEAEGVAGEAARSPVYSGPVARSGCSPGERIVADAAASLAPRAGHPAEPVATRPASTPGPPATLAPGPGPAPGAGKGRRTTALIVAGGAAAAGGAVAVAARGGASEPTTTLGSGLPPGGVSGVYVGTQSIAYAGGCSGLDDVVFNLQESVGAVSGVVGFTVRTCPCCAAGRGANPVSGTLAGERLQLQTPVGVAYSGRFSGNRLAGEISAPGGVSGSFTVDKR